ncbi:MAG TPA: helix-turn-helix transcriptional regulator [Alphaproteobacteria bacterium]|nr:helix-turn-helix transcriptional regulator [Alphaproteobacteria bacterium]
MLKHGEIWRAIDKLAKQHGMSASGLARRSGLDPTTFNPSKRTTPQGKLRWPSTESLSKVLEATGASLGDFVSLLDDKGEPPKRQRIPIIGYAQAGAQGYFDDAGFPAGSGWDEVLFPDVGDPHAYALEIAGDSMEPVYRDGDTIIVSPSAALRRGDRVVLKTVAGEVMAKQLARMSANRIEVLSLNTAHADRGFKREEVAWIARIIWASQ